MGKYFLYSIQIVVLFYTIVFLIFFVGFLYSEISRCPGETILVPKNFIGFIYIAYDEKNGMYKKEKGKMLYEISNSGVYLTSSNYSKRLHTYEHTIEFYFVDSLSNRTLIPNYLYGRDIHQLDSNSIVAIVKNYPYYDPLMSNVEYKKLLYDKPYFVYQIDSLKNITKKVQPLTKSQYENWIKK